MSIIFNQLYCTDQARPKAQIPETLQPVFGTPFVMVQLRMVHPEVPSTVVPVTVEANISALWILLPVDLVEDKLCILDIASGCCRGIKGCRLNP